MFVKICCSIWNKAIPPKKIENKNNKINNDKKISDINDIFNNLGNIKTETNSNINLSDYLNKGIDILCWNYRGYGY